MQGLVQAEALTRTVAVKGELQQICLSLHDKNSSSIFSGLPKVLADAVADKDSKEDESMKTAIMASILFDSWQVCLTIKFFSS